MSIAVKNVSLENLSSFKSLMDTKISNEIEAGVASSVKSFAVVSDVVYAFTEATVPTKEGGAIDVDKAIFHFSISSSEITQLRADVDAINNATTGILAQAKGYTDDEIDKLDGVVTGEGGFVKSVTEEDGIVTVTLGNIAVTDVPDLTLAKITDAGTAAAKDAATTAIAEDSTDTNLVSAAQVAKFVKDEVADLEGATHFRGVFDKLEDVTDPENGDIAIVGVKEYIYVKATAEATGEWKELGDESTFVAKTTTIAGVDLENDITKEEMLTALNVADGAQVNVIETVKVNGTALTPSDKAVDVTIAEGETNGAISVNGSAVAVHGLSTAATTAYATEDEIKALFSSEEQA